MCRAANGRASCFFSCVQPTIAATHPLPASLQIGKGSAAHVIIRREHAVEDLKQLCREHRGIGQPVGQHKGKGALKGVVGEDAGIEEATEKGLQGGIPLSFLPARRTKVGWIEAEDSGPSKVMEAGHGRLTLPVHRARPDRSAQRITGMLSLNLP